MGKLINVKMSALQQAVGRSNGDEAGQSGDADVLRVRSELNAALKRLEQTPETEVFGSVDDR